MPTTYAHDLYGKKVYAGLPAEIQQIIRKNVNLYRIGLHGPDILFYHMLNTRVTGTGIAMHKEIAAPFFERGMTLVRQTHDQKLLAYLLGFGCHYLLDSSCHPYVYEMAEKKVISHTLLEKEFDRTLMLETGRDPYHYYPACGVLPRMTYARVIHRAIPRINTRDILTSLRRMKLITNCLVYDNHGRRKKFLTFLSKAAGKKLSSEMMEYFMEKDPIPGSAIPVHTLRQFYIHSIEEAPDALSELFMLSHEDIPLSDRWRRTYNG
ncbi:zinc dependent phospholipase C family protein [Blautia sp. MSJ-19]|uniref:zinc dependent phospholipase C family protein n=1 Tax=Blautia sp. MSJ-19 TaxID=2841517 RepID=UPI001C0E9C05|nr:zinc dependent phospholipase C family protein [Blautia sp. MSJ-19]MBU5481915.1 zinc dependent phospholipase C family protein [Blautia sp. MSJ-19]